MLLAKTYQVKDNKLIIDLPDDLKYQSVQVLIIPVLDKNQQASQDKSQKQQFLEVLKEAQKLNPFADITDPVQWQKQQRDEWERIDR